MSQRQCVRCGTNIQERVGFCPNPDCRAPIVATAGDSDRVNEALAEAARAEWLASKAAAHEAELEARGRGGARPGEDTAIWRHHHAKRLQGRRNAAIVLVVGVVLLLFGFIASSSGKGDTYEVDFRAGGVGELTVLECREGVAIVGSAEADAACKAEEPADLGPAVGTALSIGGILLMSAGVILFFQAGFGRYPV